MGMVVDFGGISFVVVTFFGFGVWELCVGLMVGCVVFNVVLWFSALGDICPLWFVCECCCG